MKEMDFINCNERTKSPELQYVIVERILLSCVNGASINKLVFAMQRILPLPYNTIKKYLFYLINYELISYNGQKQMYTIESVGLDLLAWIESEKKIMALDIKDIVITIE